MPSQKVSTGLSVVLAIFIVTLFVTGTCAFAQQEKALHNFGPKAAGGLGPGGLILDAIGNLYGTTSLGGSHGVGNVFELTPTAGGNWSEKVLHNFNNNGTDGENPAGLIFDVAGNLYGTTSLGGAYGAGTVFELTPTTGGGWSEKVLHNFNNNGVDGNYPGGLILDAAGNLYGTTFGGGAHGVGTVFELTPTTGGGWSEKVLHNFNSNGTDGQDPNSSLIFDAAGNLYGTTSQGGAYSGDGTVFELMPQAGRGWSEKVLFNFNQRDGADPQSGLVFDAAGNLYGTTASGGGYNHGTVFELMPQAGGGWTEKVLHNFNNNGGVDGFSPLGTLLLDAAGNLYGTTSQGGHSYGGTAFELTPQAAGGWMETLLYDFVGGTEGRDLPYPALSFDAAGNLYGTTFNGGAYTYGMVFEITP